MPEGGAGWIWTPDASTGVESKALRCSTAENPVGARSLDGGVQSFGVEQCESR